MLFYHFRSYCGFTASQMTNILGLRKVHEGTKSTSLKVPQCNTIHCVYMYMLKYRVSNFLCPDNEALCNMCVLSWRMCLHKLSVSPGDSFKILILYI